MPALRIGMGHHILVTLADFGFSWIILLGMRNFMQLFEAIDDAVEQAELAGHTP